MRISPISDYSSTYVKQNKISVSKNGKGYNEPSFGTSSPKSGKGWLYALAAVILLLPLLLIPALSGKSKKEDNE